jgi:2-polyprenyl-3-methyl-5-hydroxy-6-metoxy-1,4-benzoquinol methylase
MTRRGKRRRRVLVAVAASVLALGVTGRAQLADDEIWSAFLGWLRQAPSLSGPLDALKGFQASEIARGAAPEEAARRLGVVRRLMVERGDWWPLLFDSIYKSSKPSFSQLPSTVLVEAIEGRPAGTALDVAMGQGRNAVFLAQRGWTVTGFDLSETGLAVARANAKAAGVPLTAIRSSLETFDYGTARWDLIALIYVPSTAHEGSAMHTLARALKPGGLLVIESFASDRQSAQRRPVDIDPTMLKASLSGFDVIRFDDRQAMSEWEPQPTRLCRVIARKR